MNARHRIPPRAIKRFLQLAAASMAIGLGASPALAETDEVRAATYRGENQASAQAREEVSRLYLHSIALHEDVPQYAPQGKSVRLRILDASGRKDRKSVV